MSNLKSLTPKTSANSTEQRTPNGNKVFSANVTFKECVNFLHYCRLLFKYILLLKSSCPGEEAQIRILSSWVLLLVDELKAKIIESGVTYEGENPQAK